MAKSVEITAVFRREIHRWDSTVIAGCDPVEPAGGSGQGGEAGNGDPLVIDGLFDPSIKIKLRDCAEGELKPGLTYRFSGHWTSYTNRRTGKAEKQFAARSWVKATPHSMAGIIAYLTHAPGIGHAFARALWDRFGGDAVRVLREQPETAAAAVPRFSADAARKAAEYLSREQAMEACMIDLTDLLDRRGFPRSTAKRCIQEWGNRAAKLIRDNPYLLMRFRGCGFLRTDQMYLALGGDPGRLKRQALCCWYVMARDTDGHTWHPLGKLEKGLAEYIAGAPIQGPAAARLAKRAGLLAIEKRDGKLWFAEGRKAAHERRLAELVAGAMLEPPSWLDVSALDVSDHQREELAKALQSPVAIFSGSPGTGKTYSGARVIKALIAEHGIGNVAVCAPTGKAAVRISEVMASYGVPIRAKTIHSLLVVASNSEGDGWGFEHGEKKPLPYRYIIVDESSMIDTDLMCSLFKARAKGTHILLIGDTAQLLPVGHGAPLRDMTAAGVPSGHLTEIRRNSGSIVKACAAIRDGKKFRTDQRLNPAEGANLKCLGAIGGAGAADHQARQLVAVLRKLAGVEHDGRKLDPVWDAQVIVAVNDKSQLSRKKLNQILQRELNPLAATGQGREGAGGFLPGDKIVALKNGFLPMAGDDFESSSDAADEIQANENGDIFVANGELGQVLRVEADGAVIVARFDAPRRTVKILRSKDKAGDDGDEGGSEDSEKGAGCNFDLGYAVSCHKSQGSEWPVVIVVLDDYPGARMVCSREWLYTAISRGKLAVLLLGAMGTAEGMVRRPALDKRKTFLKELIIEELARAKGVDMEAVA